MSEEWVVLMQKETPEDGRPQFRTIGPFLTEEIREKLRQGEIKYTDYLWKQGLLQWVRIGTVEEFGGTGISANWNRRREPTHEELLSSVVEVRRGYHLPKEPPPPPEAEGEDLTKCQVISCKKMD